MAPEVHMPTRKQIDNAAAIADCGSFSRASEQLFISPSALIQQINLLEKEIGFDIFARTNKGVRLTEAGRYYLNQMKQIQAREDLITETAQGMAVPRKNRLQISYLPGQSTKIAMELSHDLLAAFPELPISLSPVTIKTAEESLLSSKSDCCIMPRLKGNTKNYLTGFIISRSTLMIGIHPDLPLSRKKWISCQDFCGQKIVLPKRGTFETSDLFEDKLVEKGILFERITQDDHIAAEMTCISEKACRINGTAVEGSSLVYLPLKEDISFDMYLLFREESYPCLKECFEFIRTWSKGYEHAF